MITKRVWPVQSATTILAGIAVALLVSGCSTDYLEKRQEVRTLEARENSMARKRWGGMPGLRYIHADELAGRADAAFADGRWNEAFELYHDLAKISDKFSQYRLAVMYRRGLGVEPDPLEAYAWASIAAEFRHPDLLAYQTELAQALSDRQIEQARQRTKSIFHHHSYLGLMRKLARQFERQLNNCLGSRLGSTCRNTNLKIAGLSQSAPGTGSVEGGTVLTQAVTAAEFYGPVSASLAIVNTQIDHYLDIYGGTVVLKPLQLVEPADDTDTPTNY